MKKNEHPKQCNWKIWKVLFMLICLSSTFNLYADPLIDHVTTEVHEDKEIIRLYFNQPVQYLYHTPHSNTKTMLLGFYIHAGNQQPSRNRPVAFKQREYLQDLELFYETGFNPHLYLEFNQAVDVVIQQSQNLRGFVLIVSRKTQ